MPRENNTKDERFTHPVRTRVTAETYKKLISLQHTSNCRSIGEAARKILSREKILCYYTDTTMDAPMEELTTIRKELKAIGININQQTRQFHTAQNEAQRAYYFMKTSDLYQVVGEKVDRLLGLVTKMSVKWLQGS